MKRRNIRAIFDRLRISHAKIEIKYTKIKSMLKENSAKRARILRGFGKCKKHFFVKFITSSFTSSESNVDPAKGFHSLIIFHYFALWWLKGRVFSIQQ